MFPQGEDGTNRDPNNMELEGIDQQGIFNAYHRLEMKSIPIEHIHHVHQYLHKRKKGHTGPNPSPGSNPTLGVHTSKLKSLKKNPQEDNRKGNNLFYKLYRKSMISWSTLDKML
jgi:hypothetical protein